jgi:hypothetical protein
MLLLLSPPIHPHLGPAFFCVMVVGAVSSWCACACSPSFVVVVVAVVNIAMGVHMDGFVVQSQAGGID